MCGRFTLTKDLREFADGLGLTYDAKGHRPRYNICPSQEVDGILDNAPGRIQSIRWGFIPFWSKDGKMQMANARAEGIESKPSFRKAFKSQRCLILADGFYEWKALATQKEKQPYYFTLNSSQIFAFAGLWDTWTDPTGKERRAACLITTIPNRVVESVHDRMPVILEPRFYQMWLAENQPTAKLLELLKPLPAPLMGACPVSSVVNSPKNDSPACIRSGAGSGCM